MSKPQDFEFNLPEMIANHRLAPMSPMPGIMSPLPPMRHNSNQLFAEFNANRNFGKEVPPHWPGFAKPPPMSSFVNSADSANRSQALKSPFRPLKRTSFVSQKGVFKRNYRSNAVYETRNWDPRKGWSYNNTTNSSNDYLEATSIETKCCIDCWQVVDHLNACTDALRNDLKICREGIDQSNQKAIEAIKESNNDLKKALTEAIDRSHSDIKTFLAQELQKMSQNTNL